jgi:endo-1,4-beta-xylanase
MPNPPQGILPLRIWLICRALTITDGWIGVCAGLDRILHLFALLKASIARKASTAWLKGLAMKMHSRRDLLVGATKAALGISGTAVMSGLSAFATPLGQKVTPGGDDGPIPYGSAVRAGMLASDATYRAAIIANCQLIVPEGEMKWPDIHPARDQYRFEQADALVDFARQNKIGIRGHTLAWYGGMPEWTASISSRAEAERELVGHIETVVSRYRGEVPSWDVVNEPLIDWPQDESSLRPSIWTRHLGADYLSIALRATAMADPDAQLVLNEYDIEYEGARFAARRKALVALLRSLRDRGVPLHAVGLQAHLFASRNIDRDALQSFLAEIVALKLDVLVTELDVIDYELPADIGQRDAMVAAMADQFLGAVCGVVRPKAILTWGLTDRYTWVPTYFKRKDGLPNRPLPLDADYRRKPLYDVVEKYRRTAASKGTL